ncbi:MAG TPA: hypothetical protein VMX55_06170 [candidate division Zixibacteria bacterium]|nr:hypothetical protein [candidate division Zixibacteria bacterium]
MVFKIENDTMILDVTKAIEKERKNLKIALVISILTIVCAGIGICILILVIVIMNWDDEKLFTKYIKGNYERKASVKKKTVVFTNYPEKMKHLEK